MRKLTMILSFFILILLPGNTQETKAATIEWMDSGDWRYYVEDGYAVLGGYEGEAEEVSIPSVLGGYTVKKLRRYVFSGTNVTCITVPSTVEYIDSSAFSAGIDANHYRKEGIIDTINVDPNNRVYTSLEGIVYSKDRKKLVFYPEGRAAENFSIPFGVEKIDSNAFENNINLKSITFSDSVKTIGGYAFCDCTNLKDVHLNDGLTTIEDGAFYSCKSMISITIPKTVQSMDFRNPIFASDLQLISINVDPNNQYYSSLDGVLFDKNKKILYVYPEGRQAVSYTIPSTVETINRINNAYLEELTLLPGVKKISDHAMFYASSLVKINMPDSVEEIGEYAFYGCHSLKEITIPLNVKVIGENLFAECESLDKIKVNSSNCTYYPSNNVIPGNAVLYGHGNSTTQRYAESYGRTFVNIETNEEIQYVYDANRLLALLPLPNGFDYGEPAYPGVTYKTGGSFGGYAPGIIHEYNTSGEKYKNLKNFTDNLVKNCATDSQKIDTISKWVHANVEYKLGSLSGNSIDSVYIIFERLYGNCMCLTQLTNYMLYLEGIPTVSIIVPGHEMGAAFDGEKWCVVDSTSNYIGTSIPDGYGKVDFIIFSSGRLTFDIRNTEGVYLGAVGYDYIDQNTIKSITIPSFVQGIYKGVLDSLPQNTIIKGTVGTPAEEFCKENFKNIVYSGTEFSVVNKPSEDGKAVSSDNEQQSLVKKGLIFVREGIRYKVTKNATSQKKAAVSCVGYTEGLKGSVRIPGYVKVFGEMLEVTEIAAKAFKDNKKITSLTIPNEVCKIGNYAFAGCTKLKSFATGQSLTKIGAYAFQGDGKLKTLKIQTGKLTRQNVKKALRESAVKTLKLSYSAVGKKSYYKKIFKKLNSGRKVKMK